MDMQQRLHWKYHGLDKVKNEADERETMYPLCPYCDVEMEPISSPDLEESVWVCPECNYLEA